MATVLEDEHSLCLLVTSSFHPVCHGRYRENAVLGLCFKKLGHLGLIGSEGVLQRRALFISKCTKPSKSLFHEEICNKYLNLNDWSQGSLEKVMRLDCSGGWWGVPKFCVKCCLPFLCENLSMGTERSQGKRQSQRGGYQNVKKREGAYMSRFWLGQSEFSF